MKNRAIEWWAVFLWVWLFVLILVTLALVGSYTQAQTTIAGGTISSGVVGDTALVTVDFSETGTTFKNRFSGLTGTLGTTQPASSFYESAFAPFWHQASSTVIRAYNAVTANGGGFTIDVCTQSTGCHAGPPEPWGTDKAAWEATCADKATAGGATKDYIPWQEPDNSQVVFDTNDSGTTNDTATEQLQWSQTVEYCADAIHGVEPTAGIVVGNFFYGLQGLMGWLCSSGSECESTYVANSVFGSLPNTTSHSGLAYLDTADIAPVLTLHMFWDDWLGHWANGFIDPIRDAVAAEIVDQSLSNLDSAWGSDASGLEIRVLDYAGRDEQTDPGHRVVTFGDLHDSTASAGTISCWEDFESGKCTGDDWLSCYTDTDCSAIGEGTCNGPDVYCSVTTSQQCWSSRDCPAGEYCAPKGTSACINNTMQSLMRPKPGVYPPNPTEPRAIYYSHKWYGELAGDEANVVTSNQRIDGVAAGDDSAKMYRVLIGSTGLATWSGALSSEHYPRLTIDMQSMPISCSGTLTQQIIRLHDHLEDLDEFAVPDDLWLNSSGGASTDSNGDLSVTFTSIRPSDVIYIYFDASGC